MRKIYKITGVHCNSCLEKIKSVLEPSVKIISLTLDPPMITLETNGAVPLNEFNRRLGTIGNYQLVPIKDTEDQAIVLNNRQLEEKPNLIRTYYPLILILVYVAGVPFIYGLATENLDGYDWMHHFMAGFFLVFSAFKLLDLSGFADAYATYDLLAIRWRAYGFIYPFLELLLGLGYLIWQAQNFIYWTTVIIMGFSSLGVIKVLLEKRQIRCACLGTVLNLPMSVITLVEDLVMVFMAGMMLIFH